MLIGQLGQGSALPSSSCMMLRSALAWRGGGAWYPRLAGYPGAQTHKPTIHFSNYYINNNIQNIYHAIFLTSLLFLYSKIIQPIWIIFVNRVPQPCSSGKVFSAPWSVQEPVEGRPFLCERAEGNESFKQGN